MNFFRYIMDKLNFIFKKCFVCLIFLLERLFNMFFLLGGVFCSVCKGLV